MTLDIIAGKIILSLKENQKNFSERLRMLAGKTFCSQEQIGGLEKLFSKNVLRIVPIFGQWQELWMMKHAFVGKN